MQGHIADGRLYKFKVIIFLTGLCARQFLIKLTFSNRPHLRKMSIMSSPLSFNIITFNQRLAIAIGFIRLHRQSRGFLVIFEYVPAWEMSLI